MHISVLSPYPPLPSGISEFCFDMLEALHQHDAQLSVELYPLDDGLKTYAYSLEDYMRQKEVVMKGEEQSFMKAAQAINADDSSLCIIQHEYNLFGGQNGQFILSFAQNLHKPLVVILHTIPINTEDPQFEQKKAHILTLNEHTAQFITMTEAGKTGLVKLGISSDKITVILHGAPKLPDRKTIPDIKLSLELENAFVVTEFGVMRPSKGIELFIRSAAIVHQSVPEAQFLLIGSQDVNGPQDYFQRMKQLVADLQLTHVVRFVDNFFHRDILFQYLMASDVIVTPYERLDKISSGVLTFALAAGVPIVATPYLAATELLKEPGFITPNLSPEDIAQEIISLAKDSVYYQKRQQATEQKGSTMSWYEKGKEYYKILSYVEKNRTH